MASGNKRNKRMLKKLVSALIILILNFTFNFTFNFTSCAFEIPDKIGEWYLEREYSQPLIADVKSQDLGCVVYRNYRRNSPIGTLEIILTQGKGTGNLYVPDTVGNSKGVMSSEADYKILEISGKKAILENQSYLPLALAVNADDNVVFTIESSSLNESEIVNLARSILSWNITK